MNNPTWSNMYVNFSAIYTTASNGNSYALDSFGDIYNYDNTSSSWSWISPPGSNAIVSISASVDGSITVLDNTGAGYLYAYGAWSTVSSSALNVSAGDAYHYIVVDSTNKITGYSYGNATTISSSGGPSKVSTTANLTQIWGVDATGKVYQRNGTVWNTISGKTLKQVDVSLSPLNATQICGIDASGNGWMWTGTLWQAITKPSGVSQFVSLEAGTNTIWATDSTGAVYIGTFS